MATKPSQRKKFDELIIRLQGVARENPRQYRLRVFWLGVVGYAYIYLLLLVFFALTITVGYLCLHYHALNSATIKALLFCGFIAFVLFKALWVRMSPPRGIPLRQRDDPRIFELLSDIASRVQSPMPDVVLVTEDFNASIAQLPHLGIFGWYKSYLCLGLPLMQVLAEEEFAAVVAHEFGHISGKHGRLSCWIYRVRETWARLQESFAQASSLAGFLFIPFFKYYVPYFAAYSFVLAREQEYEADRQAAAIASPKVFSRALLLTDIKGAQFSVKVWPGVLRQVNNLPDPPQKVFESVSDELGQDWDEEAKRLRDALNAQTHNADTHPSLRDRVKAVGGGFLSDPAVVLRAALKDRSAARRIFGEARYTDIVSRMNSFWWKSVAAFWRERHRYVQKEKPALEKILALGNFPPEMLETEAVEKLQKIEDIYGVDLALPLLRKFIEQHPSNAFANFHLGWILLERDDPAGFAFLKKSSQISPTLLASVSDVMSAYYERCGEHQKALDYYNKAGEHEDVVALASDERNRPLIYRDVLESHGLPETKIGELLRRLDPVVGQLNEVCLVRRQVKHCPEEPLWIVFVMSYYPIYKFKPGDFSQKLAGQVSSLVGGCFGRGSCFVMVDFRELLKKVRKVEGACIYKRGRKT